MARLIMQKVGRLNGVDVFAPMDEEDAKLIGDKNVLVCDMKSDKVHRTELQNRSIHKFCSMLSQAFNDAGMDMAFVMSKLSKNPCLPWNADQVKERLWRPVQLHTCGIESSRKLDTDQVSVVYEALNVATSQKLGVGIPFPSRFSYSDHHAE